MLFGEDSEESEILYDLVEESDDLLLLGATSIFMGRDLNGVLGYFEATVPLYSLCEFQSHFRLTRATFEALSQEINNTGRERIPPEKQVLIFVWMMANQEVTRLVADRFNITLSLSLIHI